MLKVGWFWCHMTLKFDLSNLYFFKSSSSYWMLSLGNFIFGVEVWVTRRSYCVITFIFSIFSVFTTDFCQVYSYCACDAAGVVMFINITDFLPDSAAVFPCLLNGHLWTLHNSYHQIHLGGATSLDMTSHLQGFEHWQDGADVVLVHSWRSYSSTLAASTTACRLQGGCHGVSCASWSRATIPEWSCSCRWPALVVANFARLHHINCLFHHSGSQPSADVHFPSLHRSSGTCYHLTSNHPRLFTAPPLTS